MRRKVVLFLREYISLSVTEFRLLLRRKLLNDCFTQPRSPTSFPQPFPLLRGRKRPWERGCVLFNFYSTFVSFCVIVVICLAFCFPFQYFNVTSTLKSPVGTSQLSGYVSDYVRRYLGSGIRSLESWNRVMESGLRGKIRDRYHFGHVERGPQILTPGAQV